MHFFQKLFWTEKLLCGLLIPIWQYYMHNQHKKNSVFNFLKTIETAGNNINLGKTMLLGPVPSPIEKKAGKFRGQLLLLNANRKELHQFLDKLCCVIKKIKKANKVKWSLDVDPIDLS